MTWKETSLHVLSQNKERIIRDDMEGNTFTCSQFKTWTDSSYVGYFKSCFSKMKQICAELLERGTDRPSNLCHRHSLRYQDLYDGCL